MTAATSEPPPDGRRRGGLTLGKAMLLVAASGALLAAWRFHRESGEFERAYVSLQIEELSAAEPERRRLAAEGLASAGADDRSRVVAALARAALRDGSAEVRAVAVVSFARLVEKGLDAEADVGTGRFADEFDRGVAVLAEAAADPDATVRAGVMTGLGRLGSAAAGPAPIFLTTPIGVPTALVTPPAPSSPAGSSPPDRGRWARLLVGALEDPEPVVRVSALHALLFHLPGEEQAGGLARASELFDADPDGEVRAAAVALLEYYWPDREEFGRRLLRRLVESSPGDADRAYIASRLGISTMALVAGPEDVPRLVALLGRDDKEASRWAAWLLRDLGPAALVARGPLLERALHQLDEGDRDLPAAEALLAVDPGRRTVEARRLVEALTAAARHHPVGEMQWAASRLLMGPGAMMGLPSPDAPPPRISVRAADPASTPTGDAGP